jgi:hypothetical protein
VSKQRSRPQSEAKQSESGPLRSLAIARRFDVIAAPGRRALQGRMGTVRTILIVLALVTVGIVAYAQWLAFQPNPYPAATLAALNQARYEETFATDTPTPSPSPTALPSAELPTPTDTPIPKPTNTLVPLPKGRPKPGLTATQPTPSPAPVPAPRLVAPADGVTALETIIFQWAWEGQPLAENQAFDLRIWSVQEDQLGSPRRGVAPPTRDTQLQVSLPAVPAIKDYGPGDYLWTVVVVEIGADGSPLVVGAWGESRRLVVR